MTILKMTLAGVAGVIVAHAAFVGSARAQSIEAPSTSALINQLTNPPDPVRRWGGITGIIDLMSKRAVGQAYQNALNPETGQIDIPTFNQQILSTPLGRLNTPAALQGVGQANYAQQQAAQERIQVQHATRQAQLEQWGAEKLDPYTDENGTYHPASTNFEYAGCSCRVRPID